ncbi:creatininase family protein [Acetobacter oeni]|uniref:Creatinine amidohydrolase n=1 Tax=Acetobacter oeni TaxID=304077 RepID=A0A511XG28_9PROT|nr:creatininase family protein [Acetobacter oeni]MBB3882177.1 creatinine amidohydrolase/Fe(II)-dependent formamide hydrolase-like protein [Acetobacter oeni]NHO17934.1 creatininase family protein [Acetobacter oeni]GBR01426.1 creatininase [Acetobacter oeni LMG 21952]GEN61902.1 creatinine amidohydrolase [Acetobacter oeni]
MSFPAGAVRSVAVAFSLALAVLPGVADAAPQIEFQRLTWTEIRNALHAGYDTIIVPIGGTEQSGPYIAVGKHNVRAQVMADRIALDLGNTLVAPVIAYVPEGGTAPRTSHMRFPGTISVTPAVFSGLLRSVAESFRVQGFRLVAFIGDHGGYRAEMCRVAEETDRAWVHTGAHAACIDDYYTVVSGNYDQALRSRGLAADVGTHADLSDTSLMLAVDPSMVRTGALRSASKPTTADGVYGGDPRPATAELGQIGVDMQVKAAVGEIRKLQEQIR